MYSQSLKLFAAGAICLALQVAQQSPAFANPANAKPSKPTKPAPEVVVNSLAERQSGRGGLDLGWGSEGDEEDEPVDDRLPNERDDSSATQLEEPKSDDFFDQTLEGNSKKEDL